ncbi:MAG: hypothetical protein COA96_18255 [SAR86 cluster bacterium]|uniref:DUF1232 domain-containing protein n=1 Tax=SAR86 cluster bacterium TaxID=2030880 RepID=A0A2A5ABV9_9GAMM|nr:MAG: hypothetical protein COA96_18255 [SAR86 cluster bacterium]
MPLDITFTLSDRDLERFKTIVLKARSASTSNQGQADIEKAAYKIVEVAMNSDLPDFIAQRLLQLKVLLEMLKDDEWDLSDHEQERIMSALSYFADPIDLIPDHIPGIGFLDDAMFVEIIIRELKAEIEAYGDFCEYRSTEETRLREQGLDPDENREWVSAKRDELHSRVNKSRETSDDDDEFVFHFL